MKKTVQNLHPLRPFLSYIFASRMQGICMCCCGLGC